VLVSAVPLIRAGVKPIHIAVYRIFHGVTLSLFVSLFQALVVLALGGTFERSFGAYWMWSWMATLCFAVIIAFLGMAFGQIGQLLGIIFLILMISTSGGLNAFILAPDFFQLGYALPMQNAVMGSRTIIFGSYDRIGQNSGVILAWLFTFLVAAFITANLKMSRPPTKKQGFIAEIFALAGATFGFVDYYSSIPKKRAGKINQMRRRMSNKFAAKLHRKKSGEFSSEENEGDGMDVNNGAESDGERDTEGEDEEEMNIVEDEHPDKSD